MSSPFVSSFTRINHGNKRKNKDDNTEKKKDSGVTERTEKKTMINKSSNFATIKQLFKTEDNTHITKSVTQQINETLKRKYGLSNLKIVRFSSAAIKTSVLKEKMIL